MLFCVNCFMALEISYFLNDPFTLTLQARSFIPTSSISSKFVYQDCLFFKPSFIQNDTKQLTSGNHFILIVDEIHCLWKITHLILFTLYKKAEDTISPCKSMYRMDDLFAFILIYGHVTYILTYCERYHFPLFKIQGTYFLEVIFLALISMSKLHF